MKAAILCCCNIHEFLIPIFIKVIVLIHMHLRLQIAFQVYCLYLDTFYVSTILPWKSDFSYKHHLTVWLLLFHVESPVAIVTNK